MLNHAIYHIFRGWKLRYYITISHLHHVFLKWNLNKLTLKHRRCFGALVMRPKRKLLKQAESELAECQDCLWMIKLCETPKNHFQKQYDDSLMCWYFLRFWRQGRLFYSDAQHIWDVHRFSAFFHYYSIRRFKCSSITCGKETLVALMLLYCDFNPHCYFQRPTGFHFQWCGTRIKKLFWSTAPGEVRCSPIQTEGSSDTWSLNWVGSGSVGSHFLCDCYICAMLQLMSLVFEVHPWVQHTIISRLQPTGHSTFG